MTAVPGDISAALQRGDREVVADLVRRASAEGLPASSILNDALLPGMAVVGAKFRDYEIFLPDVLLAARAMTAAMEVLRPLLIADGVPLAGRVVLGTVQGDLHDIGKNLVGIMLQGAGFEIVDLGVDVPPDAFIDAAVARGASVIGMSALLTTTMSGMRDVIARLDERGLRGRIRTVVGGAPVSPAFATDISADGYAADATASVDVVRGLAEAAA